MSCSVVLFWITCWELGFEPSSTFYLLLTNPYINSSTASVHSQICCEIFSCVFFFISPFFLSKREFLTKFFFSFFFFLNLQWCPDGDFSDLTISGSVKLRLWSHCFIFLKPSLVVVWDSYISLSHERVWKLVDFVLLLHFTQHPSASHCCFPKPQICDICLFHTYSISTSTIYIVFPLNFKK